jgi:serine/threonine protein kinase
MARLHHGNVVAVHDVGSHEGRTFIAMQLVPGVSLDRWVFAQPRSWRSTLAVCVDAGRGLAAAHRAGMVHRDVKPQNILVGDDGVTRIADFGLAIGTARDGELEAAGGTPAYMAPEQHRAAQRQAHDVDVNGDGDDDDLTAFILAPDARSDQFSFCVTVFEALWRVRPFAGRAAGELVREAESGRIREVRLGGIPRRVHAALVRGLSPDPADRFASLDDLLAELDLRREPRPTSMVPTAPAPRGVVSAQPTPPPAAPTRQLALGSGPIRRLVDDTPGPRR